MICFPNSAAYCIRFILHIVLYDVPSDSIGFYLFPWKVDVLIEDDMVKLSMKTHEVLDSNFGTHTHTHV